MVPINNIVSIFTYYCMLIIKLKSASKGNDLNSTCFGGKVMKCLQYDISYDRTVLPRTVNPSDKRLLFRRTIFPELIDRFCRPTARAGDFAVFKEQKTVAAFFAVDDLYLHLRTSPHRHLAKVIFPAPLLPRTATTAPFKIFSSGTFSVNSPVHHPRRP